MDADIDGVHGSRVLAEVRYLKPSDAPLEPDFLGESEYMRACRQLEVRLLNLCAIYFKRLYSSSFNSRPATLSQNLLIVRSLGPQYPLLMTPLRR